MLKIIGLLIHNKEKMLNIKMISQKILLEIPDIELK